MELTVHAVYKDGVLQPDGRLPLRDMQRITITISDVPANDLDGYFTRDERAEAAKDPVTREEARRALSPVVGPLSATVIAARLER